MTKNDKPSGRLPARLPEDRPSGRLKVDRPSGRLRMLSRADNSSSWKELPTDLMDLGTDFMRRLRTVAPKKKRSKLWYVPLALLLVAGVTLAVSRSARTFVSAKAHAVVVRFTGAPVEAAATPTASAASSESTLLASPAPAVTATVEPSATAAAPPATTPAPSARAAPSASATTTAKPKTPPKTLPKTPARTPPKTPPKKPIPNDGF